MPNANAQCKYVTCILMLLTKVFCEKTQLMHPGCFSIVIIFLGIQVFHMDMVDFKRLCIYYGFAFGNKHFFSSFLCWKHVFIDIWNNIFFTFLQRSPPPYEALDLAKNLKNMDFEN